MRGASWSELGASWSKGSELERAKSELGASWSEGSELRASWSQVSELE